MQDILQKSWTIVVVAPCINNPISPVLDYWMLLDRGNPTLKLNPVQNPVQKT